MPEYLPIDNFIEGFGDTIAAKKCVLFLGPRFGRTSENKTVVETVREHLQASNLFSPAIAGKDAKTSAGADPASLVNSFTELLQKAGLSPDEIAKELQSPLAKILQANNFGQAPAGEMPSNPLAEILDEEFENLFIIKNPAIKHLPFSLKNALSRCYAAMEPGPIYEAVAKLPFRAIVSCSSDTMLQKAFDKVGRKNDYEPCYYSPKGVGKKEETIPENKTILYNLFGKAGDQDSFIVTYEDFFKFFVSLFNNNNPMPKDLQLVLDQAEIFLLLGFDMRKWYFPFIVSKLNLEKNSFNSGGFSVLTNDSFFHAGTEVKMSTAFIILESETEQALKRLHEAVSASDVTKPPEASDEPWRSEFLEAVLFRVNNGEIMEAMEALQLEETRLKLTDPVKNELSQFRSQLSRARKDRNLSLINPSQLLLIEAQTTSGLLNLLGEMKKSAPGAQA